MTPYTYARYLNRLTARIDELHVFLEASAQGEYPEAKTAAEALAVAVGECRKLHTVVLVSALLAEHQERERNRIKNEAIT